MVALLAVGRNPENPIVQLSDYLWARDLINYSNSYIAERFNSGMTGDNSDRYTQQQEMKKELQLYFNSEWNEATQKTYPRVTYQMWQEKAIPRGMLQTVVTRKYCFKKDRDPASAFNTLLHECVLNGLLIQLTPVNVSCGARRDGVSGQNPDS